MGFIGAAKRLVAVVALAGTLALLPNVSRAESSDSTVGATVCTNEPAKLSVEEPDNDSTTKKDTITIKGTTERVSSIDISIDDAINSTFALQVDQTDFTQAVTLPTGTHTVTVAGIDRCYIKNPSVKVVITYKPEVQAGGSTSTDIPGDQIYIGAKPPESAATPQVAPKTGIERFGSTFIVGPFFSIVRWLDIYHPANGGDTATATNNVGRFALFVTGLTVATASAFVPVVAGLSQFAAGIGLPKRLRRPPVTRLGMVVFGIGCVLLVFIL